MNKFYQCISTLCILATGICNLSAAEMSLKDIGLTETKAVEFIVDIKKYAEGMTYYCQLKAQKMMAKKLDTNKQSELEKASKLCDENSDFEDNLASFLRQIKDTEGLKFLGYVLNREYVEGSYRGVNLALTVMIKEKEAMPDPSQWINKFKTEYGPVIDKFLKKDAEESKARK